MNCPQFEERIAQDVDDAVVQEHLRICPACARFADQLESDRRMLRSIPPESGDVDFDAMRRQIRGAITQRQRGKRIVPVLLLAASILIAVAVTSTKQAKPPAPPTPTPTPPVSAVSNPVPANINRDVKVLKVGQAVPPARHRGSTPRTAQPDPVLEAALRDFIIAQSPPPLAPTPNEIRIATKDPKIILIQLPENNGASNE